MTVRSISWRRAALDHAVDVFGRDREVSPKLGRARVAGSGEQLWASGALRQLPGDGVLRARRRLL